MSQLALIEAEHALKGLRTRQRFRLGDRLEVEAVNVSLLCGRIDFALLGRLGTAPREAPPARRVRRRNGGGGERSRHRSQR